MPHGGGAGGKGDPGEQAQWSDGARAGEVGGEEESGGPLRPKSRAGHRGAPGGHPLSPQFTSPAPLASLRWCPPHAPLCPFAGEVQGNVRGRKGRSKGRLRGETSVLLAGWGTRFPLASRGHLWARAHGELSHNNKA